MLCSTNMPEVRKLSLLISHQIFRACGLRVIFAGIVLLVGVSPSLADTDKQCLAIWVKPTIDIRVASAVPKIDHGKSSDQIERIAKKSGYARSSEHANLLGLTHSSIGPSLGASTKYTQVIPGKYCIRLDTVKLTFGARRTDIYVDRKYRESSCAYQAILEHEKEHVRINEKIVEDYIPKLTKELASRAAAIKPFFTKHPKQAGRSMINRLLFELDPMLKEFGLARESANDVIDTREAYAETQKKCDDW